MPVQQQRAIARVVIIDGKEWLEVDLAKFRMPLDWNPDSGYYLLIAPPAGGIGGFAALAKGDPGFSPTIQLESVSELPSDHPTPGTGSMRLISEATDVAGPIYGLSLAIRRGAAGLPGAAIVSPTDYGTPVVGQMLVVKNGGTEFELVQPKFGGRHIPAAVEAVPGGTTSSPFTTAVVEVPPNLYMRDYYVQPHGTCQISSIGLVRVDLVARFGAVDGPIIGICHGMSGTKDRLIITPGPEAGSADSVGRVAAGQGALIFFNTERQAGINSYSAGEDYMRYSVEVFPAP